MRQKRDRLPLTFKNPSELKISSGRLDNSEESRKSEESRVVEKSPEEFNYKSNERIFGGDYSEKVSIENITKKSISISDLSEFPFSRKNSSEKCAKAKKKASDGERGREVIGRAREANQSTELNSNLGSSFLFGESLTNGPWELQTAIMCSRHKGEEVMYWESEHKELLCGQCLLDQSPGRMRSKGNLKNIHKSLPHLRQTIEDTVNDVNLQWQFLKNKRRELQICQGSLHTQRKSLENKFRIEIKEFLTHCVDIKDGEVSSLKRHFKGIGRQIEDGLGQIKEKVSFLGKVTETFEKLVSAQESTEKVINFYCENIKDIDGQLASVRNLNEKVETLGGKGLFQYSNEKTQIWFLKYLLGFYEKLSEFVFNRKTFFKEKLNSYEKNLAKESMEITDLPSYLGNGSSCDQRLILNSNHKTKVNPHGRGQIFNKRADSGRLANFSDLGSEGVNFHSQLNNELPSSQSNSVKRGYGNFNTPTANHKRAIPENLSEMKEDVSKHPMDSHLFRNDSGRGFNGASPGYKKPQSTFQSRRSNKKASLFGHKRQNFSNPIIDVNFAGYESTDPFQKLSSKKGRKKNFTTTPKHILGAVIKNFSQKPHLSEIEEIKFSKSRPRESEGKNDSKINTSESNFELTEGAKTNRDKRKQKTGNVENRRRVSQLEPLDLVKVGPNSQVFPLRLQTPPSGMNRFTSHSMLKNSKTERIQKWDPKGRNVAPLDAFTKFSKSSKNLKISSEISESIHKMSSQLRAKLDQAHPAKPKRQHEFFKKKNKSHKRGIQSDFGINPRKYIPGNMRQSSMSHQQHFEVHSRAKHAGKFSKMGADLKPTHAKFHRKWHPSKLQKKRKEQKWEKDQIQRLQVLRDQDAKSSLEDVFPSDSVGLPLKKDLPGPDGGPEPPKGNQERDEQHLPDGVPQKTVNGPV